MARTLIFWMHLFCGVVAGTVILMMSLTGVILTYERQMVAMQTEVAVVPPAPGQSRLSLDTLIAGAAAGEFAPDTVVLSSSSDAPVILREGRSQSVILNPYTGETLAPPDDSLSRFFASVRGWHRWFNVSGEGRDTARVVTGAANLMFLFLILSGVYLWLPAVIRWSTLRLRLWFHPAARRGQARDYNWHHVLGFWCAIPLAVIVATATVFNYAWANALVYRLAGEEVPVRGQPAPGVVLEAAAPATGTPLPLESLVETAGTYSSDWRTLTLALPQPGSALLNVTIDEGTGGQPQKRHTLQLDAYRGDTLSWLPFDSQSAGRQARSWVRFLHTGEALGIPGQTVAGVVSGAAVVMVWTGFALAWRRFRRWQLRLQRSQAARASMSSSLPQASD